MNNQIVTSYELQEELSKTAESVFQLKTGISTLDRLLDGVEAGELVIVTGPSGEGKTTLLMSITKNMSEKNIDSTWFTLEVTPRQFINKLVKTGGKLPFFYIPPKGFDDVDPYQAQQFKLEHHRDFAMIDWIEMRIDEAIERGKKEGKEVRAVFIDHIHQIFSLDRVERSISLELGEMVSKIKQIAVSRNLVVFLIAHSKDPSEGVNREPRKEDIRDSGLIVRLADSVIGVWRIPNDDDGTSTRRKEIKEEDNKAKVRVFKNRRTGKQGFFTMYHYNHYMTEEDRAFSTAVSEYND